MGQTLGVFSLGPNPNLSIFWSSGSAQTRLSEPELYSVFCNQTSYKNIIMNDKIIFIWIFNSIWLDKAGMRSAQGLEAWPFTDIHIFRDKLIINNRSGVLF